MRPLPIIWETARGVRCDASQIMIVSGSQQALEISARVLLDPGSHVWMEEPGYQLARQVVEMSGCHVVPVPRGYRRSGCRRRNQTVPQCARHLCHAVAPVPVGRDDECIAPIPVIELGTSIGFMDRRR